MRSIGGAGTTGEYRGVRYAAFVMQAAPRAYSWVLYLDGIKALVSPMGSTSPVQATEAAERAARYWIDRRLDHA